MSVDNYGYTKSDVQVRDLDRSIKKFKSRAYVTDRVLYKATNIKMYVTGVSTKNCPDNGRPLRMSEDIYMKGGHLFTHSISNNDYILDIPENKITNCNVSVYKNKITTNDNMLATLQYVHDSINKQTVDWIGQRSDLKLATADSVWHYVQKRKSIYNEDVTNNFIDSFGISLGDQNDKFPTAKSVTSWVNKKVNRIDIENPNTSGTKYGTATVNAVNLWVDKHKTATSIKNANNNTSGEGLTTAYAVKAYVDKKTTANDIKNASSTNEGCSTVYAVKAYVDKKTLSTDISNSSNTSTGLPTVYAVKMFVDKKTTANDIQNANSNTYTGLPTVRAVKLFVDKQTTISSSSDSGCATEGAVYNYVSKQNNINNITNNNGCTTVNFVKNFINNMKAKYQDDIRDNDYDHFVTPNAMHDYLFYHNDMKEVIARAFGGTKLEWVDEDIKVNFDGDGYGRPAYDGEWFKRYSTNIVCTFLTVVSNFATGTFYGWNNELQGTFNSNGWWKNEQKTVGVKGWVVRK